MGTPDTSGKYDIARGIGAVLVGYVLIGVLVVLTDQVWSAWVPGFAELPHPPSYYYAITLFTNFLYCAAGGWAPYESRLGGSYGMLSG
jgi:hypothetical protein